MYVGASAFLGYTVPVPDRTATHLALQFYLNVAAGNTIGEALRLSRARIRAASKGSDLTWASVIIYEDPTLRLINPSGGNAP